MCSQQDPLLHTAYQMDDALQNTWNMQNLSGWTVMGQVIKGWVVTFTTEEDRHRDFLLFFFSW